MLEFILTPSEKCHHWVSGGHDNCRNQLPFRFTNSASTGSIRSFRDSREEEKKKSWAENDFAGKLFRSQTDYPHESKIHIHLSSKYIQDKSKYPDFKANRKSKSGAMDPRRIFWQIQYLKIKRISKSTSEKNQTHPRSVNHN